MRENDNGKTLNTGRQFEIDLLKAFCIILMIVCHVFDGLTTAGESDGLLKHTIYFFGNTSAGLFIFSMGIGMVYTSHGSPAAFAKRGVKLLLQGYLLNFFKDFLPSLIVHGFDVSQFTDKEDLYTVFTTEILVFAGLAFLLTALLKKLNGKPWVFCAVVVAFQVFATVFNGKFDNSPLAIRYLMGIVVYTGSPVISTYPLFPFFIYVVFGMLFGDLLKHTANKRAFYLKTALSGAAVCAAASVIYRLTDCDISDYIFTDVYHANILPAAVWYLSQAAVWAAVFYPLSLVIKRKARNAVEYLSHNITNIYVIQWISLVPLSFAILLVTGDLLPPAAGLPLSAAVCLVTIVLSRLWNKIKTKVKKKKERTNVAAAE